MSPERPDVTSTRRHAHPAVRRTAFCELAGTERRLLRKGSALRRSRGRVERWERSHILCPRPVRRGDPAVSSSPFHPRRIRPVLAALLAGTLLAGGAAGTAGADEPPGPDRLDNPYAGARVYVNPEWSARAASEPGGTVIADQPTAVWLDRIASIDGADGAMGLRDHLDAALAQGADLVQLVLFNLPNRDCGRALSGELGPGRSPGSAG